MRIFSLTTKKDFISYIASFVFFVVPFSLILLVSYFIYPAKVIDGIGYIFSFTQRFPVVLQWVIFTMIPAITVGLFFLRDYRTIFIDKDNVEIENKAGAKEKIYASDIDRFIAYKTTTPWTWVDLSKEVNYSSEYPVVILKKDGVKLKLFMKGEVWNALKTYYPYIHIQQMSVFNHYSFVIVLLGLLNIADAILYLMAYFASKIG